MVVCQTENETLTTEKINSVRGSSCTELQAQLAQTPVFINDGLPTINLSGENQDGDPDPDTGIARRVILNAGMNNVTSRTLTIYKITPGKYWCCTK